MDERKTLTKLPVELPEGRWEYHAECGDADLTPICGVWEIDTDGRLCFRDDRGVLWSVNELVHGERFEPIPAPADRLSTLEAENGRLRGEVARLDGLINRPSIHEFARSVTLEAAHQVERWGVQHDAGKEPQDWFWLVGYLAGKALRAATEGDQDKALHHCISTAAALANWHAALEGSDTRMRPGIETPKEAR